MALDAVVSHPYSLFLYAMKSPYTRQQYTIRLRKFFTQIPIDGPIELQCFKFMEASSSNKDFALGHIMRFLYGIRRRIDNKEVTHFTIHNYMKPIKLFCEMNDIPIKWEKLTRGLPTGRKWADDRPPSIEEIRQIVGYPDRRIKPIIYTMASSGIRVGAWDFLKWGHITKVDGAARMLIYAGEKEQYFTYMTPEAYTALEEWMEFRKKAGENVTKDSWLMRNLWDTRGLAAIPAKLEYGGLRALTHRAIRTQLRTKLESGKRRYEIHENHGFRKFFRTRTEQAGMNPNHIKRLMGHSMGLDDSYYKPTEQELLKDYLKAVPLLTINEPAQQQVDVTHDPQFLKLVQALIDGGQLKADWSKT
jgi:hypothetical protein